jgi:hypothetical protein
MQSITRSTVGRCVGILRLLETITETADGIQEVLLFLGLWEGQANENITLFKNWSVRKDFIPRKHNAEIGALVNPENVLLPPLHMKLWFMKNLVKAWDKSAEGFLYLEGKFSNFTHTKVK